MLRKLCVVLFFTVCLSIIAYAQEYSYKRYTVDDGLPTNAVYGGMQDSRGYIWFYTEKGIARFDGYEFKTYTKQDGLPTNDVFYMTEDQYGQFWLSSFAPKLVIMDVERDTFIIASTSDNRHASHFEIYTNGHDTWTNIVSHDSLSICISSNNTFILKVCPHWESLIALKRSYLNTFYYSPFSCVVFPSHSNLTYLLDISASSVDSFFIKNLTSRDVYKLQKND